MQIIKNINIVIFKNVLFTYFATLDGNDIIMNAY